MINYLLAGLIQCATLIIYAEMRPSKVGGFPSFISDLFCIVLTICMFYLIGKA